MRILGRLPAARGVYPPEAEECRLNLMRSYTTPATQVDADYMPAAGGLSARRPTQHAAGRAG